MPRKATGKPPGRPRVVRREDGKPDPIVHRPSPEAQRALEAELHFYRLQEKGRADDKPWPVLAFASRVARRARIEPRTVQKLRKEWWYECHFWTAALSNKAKQRDWQKREAKKPRQMVTEPLADWLWKIWPEEGFKVSPINGRRYHKPETYARHMRSHDVKPYDWFRWSRDPEN